MSKSMDVRGAKKSKGGGFRCTKGGWRVGVGGKGKAARKIWRQSVMQKGAPKPNLERGTYLGRGRGSESGCCLSKGRRKKITKEGMEVFTG